MLTCLQCRIQSTQQTAAQKKYFALRENASLLIIIDPSHISTYHACYPQQEKAVIEINVVYTKTGDNGTTSLGNDTRVSKDALRVEALGTLDELNAHLGLTAAMLHDTGGNPALGHQLLRIQNEVFNLGAEIAVAPDNDPPSCPHITSDNISQLETEIDEQNQHLSPLTSFILPGGSQLAAQIHVTRTVCRRSERRLVSLAEKENLRAINIQYINRLSDWLFVMSRHTLREHNITERFWTPK